MTALGGDMFETLLMSLVIIEILEIPVNWSKVKGGVEYSWVGYWEDLVKYRLGISESRCQWCIDWCHAKSSESLVLVREVREGLGRLTVVSGPLYFIRPFLGPLFAWTAACPPGICLGLPVVLKLVLSWIGRTLERRRSIGCSLFDPPIGELFRVDAKAEGLLVAIAAWSTQPSADTLRAKWFCVQLSPKLTPWAYERTSAAGVPEPFPVVASLELLPVLVAVMVFCPLRREVKTEAEVGCYAGTDSQVNQFVVEKFLTTRFPLCVILMQLASQLDARGLNLKLNWRPREKNIEAEALINFDFTGFRTENRLEVNFEELEFLCLRELFEKGAEYLEELAWRKMQSSLIKLRPRREPKGRLRLQQPW